MAKRTKKPAEEQSKKRTYRVLIADDNSDASENLKVLFQRDNEEFNDEFEVECVGSADEGIQSLRDLPSDSKFNVIILDMHMPDEAGQEPNPDAGLIAARVLKRYGGVGKDVIVAVFTAYPSAGHCFAVNDAGVYYLPKNVRGFEGPGGRLVSKKMGLELVDECKRRLRQRGGSLQTTERGSSPQTTERSWLVDHYAELVETCAGKAVAIVNPEVDTKGMSTKTVGGCKVICSKSVRGLNQKIMGNRALREAMPVVMEIWSDQEAVK